MRLDQALDACQGSKLENWCVIPAGEPGSDLLVGLADVASSTEPPALAALTHQDRAVYLPDASLGLGWGMDLRDWREDEERHHARPEWADQDWSGVERHYAHVLLNGVMVWRVLYAWINVGAGMSGVMPWPGREFEERAELGQVFPPAGWDTTRWEVEFARLINDLSGNDDFDFDAALKGFGLLIRDDSPIDLAKRRL